MRHHRAFMLLFALCAGCRDDSPTTCEAYAAAMERCFSQAGLDHRPGQGYALACDRPRADYASNAYFRCVTEILEASSCDSSEDPFALEAVAESIAECHPGHVPDSGER